MQLQRLYIEIISSLTNYIDTEFQMVTLKSIFSSTACIIFSGGEDEELKSVCVNCWGILYIGEGNYPLILLIRCTVHVTLINKYIHFIETSFSDLVELLQ